MLAKAHNAPSQSPPEKRANEDELRAVRADGPLVLTARQRIALAAETFMGDNPDLLARLAK